LVPNLALRRLFMRRHLVDRLANRTVDGSPLRGSERAFDGGRVFDSLLARGHPEYCDEEGEEDGEKFTELHPCLLVAGGGGKSLIKKHKRVCLYKCTAKFLFPSLDTTKVFFFIAVESWALVMGVLVSPVDAWCRQQTWGTFLLCYVLLSLLHLRKPNGRLKSESISEIAPVSIVMADISRPRSII